MTGVCSVCWDGLAPWRGPICDRCGLPLASGQFGESTAQCGSCRRDAFDFDCARCLGAYRGLLRAAILQMKFQHRERLGIKLGKLLGDPCLSLFETAGDGAWVIVPVPLHRTRHRERGFNQAGLLALGLRRALARTGKVPLPAIDRQTLVKTRATPPQTGLSVAARRENVRGAFAVAIPERVRGRTAILVDDVMTTGATLSACALALKHAGARQVLGLTLARATPQFTEPREEWVPADIDDSVPSQP